MRRLPLLVVLVAACGGPSSPPAPALLAPPADALVKESAAGPVKARVSVWPKAPVLGDPIYLELAVEAEAGVVVELPPFGEALGRFNIVDYAPRHRPGKGGGTVEIQRYTLDAPMSGKQRIPPFLVLVTDRRGGGDAGTTASELETEEVSLEIGSVVGEDAPLRPARGALPEKIPGRARPRWVVPAVAGGVAVLLGAVAALVLVGRRRRRGRSAYEAADARLAALEARGAPALAVADAWHVELSDIIRRYLEDRFALRAPERTTEEFLREISATDRLAPAHRALLAGFLERCDQVKFAGHEPQARESLETLATARRFVDETRPREEQR